MHFALIAFKPLMHFRKLTEIAWQGITRISLDNKTSFCLQCSMSKIFANKIANNFISSTWVDFTFSLK